MCLIFQFIGGIREGQTRTVSSRNGTEGGKIHLPSKELLRCHVFHVRRKIPGVPERIRNR